MEAFRIRSCYCMSLTTAGIIISCVELILAVTSIALLQVLMVSLFDLIVNILWLYGIYVKNHRLLVPSIILMTVFSLWSLFLPFDALTYEFMILHQFSDFGYTILLHSICSWIIVALFAFVLNLKYSIYKYMVESGQGSQIICNS